ncbi:phage holin [Terribacillus saccharophilus]|uniref:Phage holin n=1 Tax=Terribacillus saccharophilus TaxID=361277 RepID=A0A268HC91_9BACI|nr:phage holin [Terribacillus saccharophilus]PAE07492.1 phage holin [Terribacillus saccharophilus]
MDNGTIIRTIVLAVALINQFLIIFDKSPLPFNNIELEQILSSLFTFAASLIAWYKNNYVTKKGKLQKEVLQQSNLTRS